MRFSDEFRDKDLAVRVVERINALAEKPAVIMEVCGTHTMSAARFGLKSLLPETVRLISGPGCPVCVTAQADVDAFISLGERPDTVLTTFGDMLRVPGSVSSLEKLRAQGGDVHVVYSPLDAVARAADRPEKQVVFFGVGFETTMPAVALAIKTAAEQDVANFSVYCVHKTMPAAIRALLSTGEVQLSGLMLPGHVSTITGAGVYEFIPRDFGIPCAVTGFEPVDMLLGVESILKQIRDNTPTVDNAYTRAVRSPANPRARALLEEVFVPCDAVWRGLGVVPGSGVRISDHYAQYDAQVRFPEAGAGRAEHELPGCRCGEVLRGVISPNQCAQFGKNCTPEHPMGPCMVSSEGACAAAFRYGGV